MNRIVVELNGTEEFTKYLEEHIEFKDPVNFSFKCSIPGCENTHRRTLLGPQLLLIKLIYEDGGVGEIDCRCSPCMTREYNELYPETF